MRGGTRGLIGICSWLIAFLMLGGACATTAAAQSPVVPSVEAGKPFKVAFDHDGANVTEYHLLLNGKQVAQVPASARVGGVVTIDLAALPVGSYSLVAIARNAPSAPFTDPVETSSTTYIFEARTKAPAPNPPVWRIVTLVMADGSTSTSVERVVLETLRLAADTSAIVK